MSCPFVYVNGTLSLVLQGKTVQITPEHPSYGLIKKSLATASEAELLKLCDVQTSMETFVRQESQGKAIVANGVVYFNGKPVHNTLTDRVLEFMREGLPFRHLLKFMENCDLNPSNRAKEELFDFLQNKSLPITEDGCFLAYKAVKGDFFDKHSGTICNKVGSIVEVPRNAVDDERANECSYGLHAGALEYASNYGSNGDKMLIVKINPRDAVSVPKDCSYQKLRTCRYEVISEFVNEMKKPLYTAKAEEVDSPISDESYDWSWSDKDVCHKCDCDEDDWDDCDEDEGDWEDEEDDEWWTEEGEDLYLKALNHRYNLGTKPNGQKFHNKRDNKGRFTSR